MGEVIDLGKELDDCTSSTSDVIPDGPYAMKIVSAAVSKGSAGSILKPRYEVISEGPYKGKQPFPDSISMAEQSRWNLINFLKAIKAPGKMKQFDIEDFAKKIVGKTLIVFSTVDKEYDSTPRNKFSNHEICDEQKMKDIAEREAQVAADAPATAPDAEVASADDW